MKRSMLVYLKDMRENLELALVFVKGVDYDGFSKDVQVRYAVVRCLEIVGEAARNISLPMREEFPFVPWRDIVGMRNKIAHGYFDINWKTVWGVLKEDIPEILPPLRNVEKNLPEKYR